MALILASQSPRRKVLMGFITTSFTVDVPTEEIPFVNQTDHVIDCFTIHRQTGISRFLEHFLNLVHGEIFANRMYANSRY